MNIGNGGGGREDGEGRRARSRGPSSSMTRDLVWKRGKDALTSETRVILTAMPCRQKNEREELEGEIMGDKADIIVSYIPCT